MNQPEMHDTVVFVEDLGEEPEYTRPDTRWKPGQSGNPAGRPKGQSLTEYARNHFFSMSDEEKEAYIQAVEAKRPGFMLEIAEGKARENKHISISAPTPILGGSTGALTLEENKQIQGEIAKDVLE